MYQNLLTLNRELPKPHFRPYSDFFFASREMTVEVVVSELTECLSSTVLAFLAQGEDYRMVALLSLMPEKNFYVSPAGQWLAPYTPAIMRAYPFALLPTHEGHSVVCIDEAALVAPEEGSRPLYDEQGQPSEILEQATAFMQKYANDQRLTRNAALQLHHAGLLSPWPLTLEHPDKPPLTLEGLWRVDETALKQLPLDKLGALCQSGALAVAYAQLFSQQRMAFLQHMASVQADADEKKQRLDTQMKNLFDEDDGNIKFDF